MTALSGRNIDFGGGVVRRRFNHGAELVVPGKILSKSAILSMGNWRSMVRVGTIDLFPEDPAPSTDSEALRAENLVLRDEIAKLKAPKGEKPKKHVIGGAGGRFSVYEGVKLNDTPLTREEAEQLAAE